MTMKLTEKVHSVVDRDLKDKLVAAAEREERSEGAIIRRALRAYFASNGALTEEATP